MACFMGKSIGQGRMRIKGIFDLNALILPLYFSLSLALGMALALHIHPSSPFGLVSF